MFNKYNKNIIINKGKYEQVNNIILNGYIKKVLNKCQFDIQILIHENLCAHNTCREKVCKRI